MPFKIYRHLLSAVTTFSTTPVAVSSTLPQCGCQSHTVVQHFPLNPAPRRAAALPPRAHPTPVDRRALLATLAAAPLVPAPADALPFFGSKAPALPPNVVQDDTLAYTFTYPLATSDGTKVPVTASRKPEKYSSAAPLTADARQRIVSQFVSLADGITMTVFVGPAAGVLAGVDPAKWRAKDVATAVLSDRSAVRPHPHLPSQPPFQTLIIRVVRVFEDSPSHMILK